MYETATQQGIAEIVDDVANRCAKLRHLIEHLAHLLPAQGPITVFVHHNTLHAFEEFPFTDAVVRGARMFGCQPYLPEDQYRRELQRGRIRKEDLVAVLIDDLGERAEELLGFLGTRFHLRLAMLEHPWRMAQNTELRWMVAETDALRKFREEVSPDVRQRVIEETRHWVMRDLRNGHYHLPARSSRRIREMIDDLLQRFGKRSIERWSDSTWEAFCLQLLWRTCHQGVHGVKRFAELPPRPVRHRDLLIQATGQDSDCLVHDVLIRFCAAFLDQGLAHWSLPGRAEGFYRAFFELYRAAGGPPDRWLRGLRRELMRLKEADVGPLDSIAESLDLLGVAEHEHEPFLAATLLALRGWAGMLWQVEQRGDRVAHPIPAGSLIEYLAVRLILERLALAHVAKESLGFSGPLHELRKWAGARIARYESVSVDQRAFLVFQLAQVRGWKPQDLYRLSKPEWSRIVAELEAFSGIERRRIFHLAYERRYRRQTLDAIAIQAEHNRIAQLKREPSGRPGQTVAAQSAITPDSASRTGFQVVCCIDERAESFRRHLEEVAPDCETFGTAGFFAVAMYYRGAGDAHYIPLCPVVIRPQHYVAEEVAYPYEAEHRRRAKTRRALGAASHRAHVGSRTLLGGAVASLVGSGASVPLVARILFPRVTAQIRRLFGHFVQTPPATRLLLERSTPTPGASEGGIGYTVDEMADIVERLLRDIGLTTNLAPLVVIVGHGSSSLNNPHESAHDCGACGGGRGGPNSRTFAQMANDPRVRDIVARRGLKLPRSVYFVGAYHNTCDDSLIYYDLDRLPSSHSKLFTRVKQIIDQARQRDAHERCRRFESAPLNLTAEAALRHVEGRAEDLAQVRPEYGHATNAICVVGRRWRTRGLFLDRRAFLASYDPTQDDEQHSILTRILESVVPVCGGISLEYYFSVVDPAGYGCATKLPHNITALLGVMDGAASDLRPGLPWQMVEIHEPLRLLFIVEAKPDTLLRLIELNEGIGLLFLGGWVQLATLDPESATIHLYRNGTFEVYEPESRQLPQVASSVDWYRGWRDHLAFASVTGQGSQKVAGPNLQRGLLSPWN